MTPVDGPPWTRLLMPLLDAHGAAQGPGHGLTGEAQRGGLTGLGQPRERVLLKQFNSEAVSLLPGGLGARTVSFADGFAAANYKFVSSSSSTP